LPRTYEWLALKGISPTCPYVPLGDLDRWRELAQLNGIRHDNPYRMGGCLKVFDVAW